jgi:DNA polymerase III epsilon subunit-like protein
MNEMINYNFIALDLEMNQPSGKVIEVGVAIGNVNDGVLEMRNWYVDPQEPIEEYITQLTGIDDEKSHRPLFLYHKSRKISLRS